MTNQNSWRPNPRKVGDAIRAAHDRHYAEGKEAFEYDFNPRNHFSGRRMGVGKLYNWPQKLDHMLR